MKNKFDVKKNFLTYIIGLLFYSLGASLSTKAELGITPITSVGYITAYISGLTIGITLFILNVIFVLLQLILLGKEFNKKDWLQIPISIIFSFFIDFTMYCVSFVHPENLLTRFVTFVIALIIMGIGIAIVMICNVIILPADGVSRAVALKKNIEFGNVKVIIDSILVIVTVVISLVFLKRLEGIHVGTVIAAICLGKIAKWFMQRIKDPIADFIKYNSVIKEEAGFTAANGRTN